MKGLDYCEKKCRRCGKKFIVHGGEWAFYKHDSKWWCSWGCMRADERENLSKAERRERIQQAIKDGLTTNEIVSLLHEEKRLVTYWQEKMGANADGKEESAYMGQ